MEAQHIDRGSSGCGDSLESNPELDALSKMVVDKVLEKIKADPKGQLKLANGSGNRWDQCGKTKNLLSLEKISWNHFLVWFGKRNVETTWVYCETQCENQRIFLLLRFYVKWIFVSWNLQKNVILTFFRPWILILKLILKKFINRALRARILIISWNWSPPGVRIKFVPLVITTRHTNFIRTPGDDHHERYELY